MKTQRHTPRGEVPRTAVDLRQAVGGGAQRLREASGRTQEQVARIARRYGLPWDRTRVTALERGEKTVSVDELIALLLVFREVATRPVSLVELLGGPGVAVSLLRHGEHLAAAEIADLMAGKDPKRVGQVVMNASVSGDVMVEAALSARSMLTADATVIPATLERLLEAAEAENFRDVPEDRARALRRAVDLGLGQLRYQEVVQAEQFAGEAEEKAARKLAQPKMVIIAASVWLWRWTLTQERDMRTTKLIAADPGKSTRAVRGHVTRELLTELADVLEPGGPGVRSADPDTDSD